MKKHLIFVGEKRSPRAIQLGVRWQDEALAAKPLFAALWACGIEPTDCTFVNWFDERSHNAIRIAASLGACVFAMGQKVQYALSEAKIPFTPLVHPAVRGRIRKRERYIAYVQGQLLLAKARFLCSLEHPMQADASGRWEHDDMEEIGDQEDGWPSGDTVTMRCRCCGKTWSLDAPLAASGS